METPIIFSKTLYDLGLIKSVCNSRRNVETDEIEKEMYADWVDILDNAIRLIKKQEKELRKLRPEVYEMRYGNVL